VCVCIYIYIYIYIYFFLQKVFFILFDIDIFNVQRELFMEPMSKHFPKWYYYFGLKMLNVGDACRC